MPPVPDFSATATPADASAVIEEIGAGHGITIGQAARLLPGSRGRPCNPATLYRWAAEGIALPGGGRAFLEVARVGCRWHTSKAAVLRFLRAQNPHASTPAPAESSSKRERQIGEAEGRLRAAGV
jgi:hypothetical protein